MTVSEDIYDKFISPSSQVKSCRLSIRDKVFRKIINGKEEKLDQDSLQVVIVKAASISRMYYAEKFGASGNTIPTCWSADCRTGVPSPNVLTQHKQNPHCFDCKQNIKGSGIGNSLACGFKQRLGVVMLNEEGNLDADNVFRLDVPANSIFPKDPKKLSLRGYGKVLSTNKTRLAALITEIRFDNEVDIPKLVFKPLRALEQAEVETAFRIQKDDDTAKLVKLDFKPQVNTPVNTDSVFDVVEGEGVYTKET